MKSLPNSAKKLIQEFSNLPGIGKKTAQRLTFYILQIEEEKVFNLATDAGANDCIFHDDYYEIHTDKDEIYNVKNILEKEISNFISTEIEWVPINKIKLNGEDKEKMIKFLEILEEDDDVQNVFTNAI